MPDDTRPPCAKCGAPSTITLGGRDPKTRVSGCASHAGWARRRAEKLVQRARTARREAA